MNLYFIALIPHPELCEEIRIMKEEMNSRYNAKIALKSPAHITLLMPFKRKFQDENAMIGALGEFAAHQMPFSVELNGFDCFAPRVIFIKIVIHLPITHLHSELNQMMTQELGFKTGEIQKEIHPHITLATRDLTNEAFRMAWPEFEKRQFEGSFEAKSLFLLRHNGKSWDVFQEFPFAGNESPG